MKAIDTNILIRFLVKDHPAQSKKVFELFNEHEIKMAPLFISNFVLLETIWVLESVYNATKSEIIQSIQAIFRISFLKFENPDAISQFLSISETTKLELSDCLIGTVNESCNCDGTLTFDKKAAKEAGLFKLL